MTKMLLRGLCYLLLFSSMFIQELVGPEEKLPLIPSHTKELYRKKFPQSLKVKQTSYYEECKHLDLIHYMHPHKVI